jgi:phosphopantetheinyl transferase
VSREYRVGVDIEGITPKVEKIIHKFLSAQEQLLLPAEEKFTTATLFWCVKESVYKWKGLGSVDFIRHINIRSVEYRQDEGLVHCIFNNEIPLHIHYLNFNNNCLTWVLTMPEV